eukprot:8807925-Pyramimonas_sp.AAC.1
MGYGLWLGPSPGYGWVLRQAMTGSFATMLLSSLAWLLSAVRSLSPSSSSASASTRVSSSSVVVVVRVGVGVDAGVVVVGRRRRRRRHSSRRPAD